MHRLHSGVATTPPFLPSPEGPFDVAVTGETVIDPEVLKDGDVAAGRRRR
jgi:hypothetical protein